jgi:hypothetical protein
MAEYQLLILIRVAWCRYCNDLEHFVENNGLLESLFNDFRGCLHNGDSVVVFLIVFQTVELLLVKVQGRAKDGLLKSFQNCIGAGQVYRKKIDITFDGFELQEMKILGLDHYNKADGSHPWKMSFMVSCLVNDQTTNA